jgi:hypothetical protein
LPPTAHLLEAELAARQGPAGASKGRLSPPALKPSSHLPPRRPSVAKRRLHVLAAGAPMSACRPVPRPHGHARPTWRAEAAAAARQIRSWPRHFRSVGRTPAAQRSIGPFQRPAPPGHWKDTLDVSSAERNAWRAPSVVTCLPNTTAWKARHAHVWNEVSLLKGLPLGLAHEERRLRQRLQ